MKEEKEIIEKKKIGRKIFDGKDEEIVIAKCKEVWAIGGNNAEAAFYTEISETSLCRYLQTHPELDEIRKRLLEKPILKARQEVVKGLEGNPEFSLKYLERKRKDEFSTKQDIEVGGSLTINKYKQLTLEQLKQQYAELEREQSEGDNGSDDSEDGAGDEGEERE